MTGITDEQFAEVQRLGGELLKFGVWQSIADGRAFVAEQFGVSNSKRLSCGQAKVLLLRMRMLLEEQLQPPANMVPASEIRWV